MALIKCPKCGHQVSDLATECPNCGLAIKDALHQYLCPDCGKLITDNSAQCPNCGCPPEHFIVKPAEAYTTDKPNYNPSNLPSNNKTKTSPSQKEGSNYGVIIFCIVALFAAVIFIPIYSHLQKERVETEQIEYEHQQRAEQEAREREEERAREREEQQNKQRMKDISRHNWKTVNGSVYGRCVLTVLSFKSNGKGYCSTEYFVGGNRINSSGFNFNYRIDGERVYISGDYTFDFDGYNLVHRSGERYESGSSIFD